MLRLELKKIKLLNIIIAVLIVPLLANAFGVINYLGNKEVLTSEWKSLWTQVSLFYFSFFIIPVISIIVATLWQVEHKAGLKNIRMSPIKNINFVISKVIISLVIILITQIYFLLLFYVGGKFICKFSSIDFTIFFYYILLSIVLSIPIILILNAISIKFKSLGVVVLISVILSIFGFSSSAQNLIPILSKTIGLSFLSLCSNNWEYINSADLLTLLIFGVFEIIISLILSNKFLKYEN
ncbi:ABC transporter permease [Peptoniphilus sp. MSJ-1]|uniref:ABC transporter permease n=1 Tax=Peptoniphilus ovalis TaxID=2841503 RepID=A0ABS6FHV9_9FIRM|nr:ABC transporter permease [Peptoniphilus ovalis]MBU5669759.1 ABC transporter permease [Peptoniphilus ovalis]